MPETDVTLTLLPSGPSTAKIYKVSVSSACEAEVWTEVEGFCELVE